MCVCVCVCTGRHFKWGYMTTCVHVCACVHVRVYVHACVCVCWQALQMGVYDHIPGDGRELVVIDRDAVTIRAEDGRRFFFCEIKKWTIFLSQKKLSDKNK